jgi:hypothetical protein
LKKIRWTLILAGPLAVLAAAALRGRSEEAPAPPKAKAPVIATYSGTTEATTAPDAVVPVETPLAAPTPTLPVERRKARDEGYREAREASWEGSLSGRVVSAGGPVANFAVRVEWVLAHQPDPAEVTRLKRVGARRDRDGTWWARSMAMTDESGGFLVEGLPAVPLRVHAGNVTQMAQVGGFTQLHIEPP